MYCYHCGAAMEKSSSYICPLCGTDNAFLAETIQRAAAGDAEAFGKIYERSYMSVRTTVRGVIKNETDAEDIIQDTYVKAYQSLGSVANPAAFRTWICTIARNKALDYVRKNRPVVFTDMSSETDEGDEFVYEVQETDTDRLPEEAYEQKEMQHLLFDELLAVLPEEQRVAVSLVLLEERTEREAAEILGVSPNTVKSRVRYARKKLTAKAEEMKKRGVRFYGVGGVVPFMMMLYRKLMMLPLAEGAGKAAAAGIIQAAGTAAVGAAGIGAAASGAAIAGNAAGGVSLGAMLAGETAAGAAASGTAAGTSLGSMLAGGTAAGIAGGAAAKTGLALSLKIVLSAAAASLVIGGGTVGGIALHRRAARTNPDIIVASESVPTEEESIFDSETAPATEYSYEPTESAEEMTEPAAEESAAEETAPESEKETESETEAPSKKPTAESRESGKAVGDKNATLVTSERPSETETPAETAAPETPEIPPETAAETSPETEAVTEVSAESSGETETETSPETAPAEYTEPVTYQTVEFWPIKTTEIGIEGFNVQIERVYSPNPDAPLIDLTAASSREAVYVGDKLHITYVPYEGAEIVSHGPTDITIDENYDSSVFTATVRRYITFNIVCKSVDGTLLHKETQIKPFEMTGAEDVEWAYSMMPDSIEIPGYVKVLPTEERYSYHLGWYEAPVPPIDVEWIYEPLPST